MSRALALALLALCAAACGSDGAAPDDAADGDLGPHPDADTAEPADAGADATVPSDGALGVDAPGAFTPAPLPAGFTWLPTHPDGALLALSAAGDRMVAVGEHGAILHFDGAAWAPARSPTSATLRGVWLHESGLVYAVGDGGVVLRGQGGRYERIDVGTDADLFGVHARHPSEVFAVGAGGEIRVGRDGEWTREESSWAGPLHAVWVDEGGTPFAATHQSQVLRRAGDVWIASPAAGSGTAIRGLSGHGKVIYAVGDRGAVSRWSGTAWTVLISNDTSERTLHAVWALPDDRAFAVGDGGVIVEWADAKWTLREPLGPLYRLADLRAVAAVWRGPEEAPLLVATGEPALGRGGALVGGVALVSGGEAGEGWRDARLGLDADLFDVWVDEDAALAVGASGIALASDGPEDSFGAEPTGTTADLRAVYRGGDGAWWVAGDGGVVLRRDADGWQPRSTAGGESWRGVCELGGAVWVVGDQGRIRRGDGVTWQVEPSPFAGTWHDVWPLDGERLLAVGDHGAAAVRGTQGEWSLLPLSLDASLRRARAVAGQVYIGGDRGTLLFGTLDDLRPVGPGGLEFVRGLWMTGSERALAVGWGGLHWDVQASAATPIVLGTGRVLEGIMGRSATDYVMVGRGGAMLHYRADGR